MTVTSGAADEKLVRYARLVLRVGANVQPGQTVAINALLEHAPFVRALAREAYEAGARYVDVYYLDQHVRRSHIEQAGEEVLGFSPPWLVRRYRTLGEEGGSLVVIVGDAEPDLFADLDGDRLAKANMREAREEWLKLTDGLCNWTIVAYPTESWAEKIFGKPDLERLWRVLATAVRLDAPDPVAAWQEHLARLDARASALNERAFDHIRYRGPGTDLTVGLHEASEWQSAPDESRGIKHVANMPTEEVFTTPDARRVDGKVRSTLPLQIQGNNIVRDLELRFENGRAVEVRAASGEDFMRTHVATDDGASKLGEIALVDRDSTIGKAGVVFYEALLDENASSHIALGKAIVQCAPWSLELSAAERHGRGVNYSSVHTDFMIGSDELEVDGVDASGRAVPLLRGGVWQLD